MLLFAIDLGTRIENPSGGALLSFGNVAKVITTTTIAPAAKKIAWEQRIDQLGDAIDELINIHKPEILAYEIPHLRSFTSKSSDEEKSNPQVLRKLSVLEGTIRRIARCHHIELVGVQPNAAKIALANNMLASKTDMLTMARRCWYPQTNNDHEADAIGIGLAAEGIIRRQRLIQQAEAA